MAEVEIDDVLQHTYMEPNDKLSAVCSTSCATMVWVLPACITHTKD